MRRLDLRPTISLIPLAKGACKKKTILEFAVALAFVVEDVERATSQRAT